MPKQDPAAARAYVLNKEFDDLAALIEQLAERTITAVMERA